MCNTEVDAFLSKWKRVPNWFVKSEITELDDDLFSNYDIIFVNEDSNYVTFFSDDMCIVSVDLDNIKLDDINFDENDPKTIDLHHYSITAWWNCSK